MKQVKLSTGEWLFVKIPEDSYDFKLSRDEADEPTYISYLQKENGNYRDGFDCPELYQPKYYQIIGKASELSEHDWKGIVEHVWDEFYFGCKDYTQAKKGFKTCTESGLSLVASHNMKPETTLLLKKI